MSKESTRKEARFWFIAGVVTFFLVLSGCGPSYIKTIHAEKTTLYYELEGTKRVDTRQNACESMQVRVYAQSRLYTSGINQAPPQRMVFTDSDCRLPIQMDELRFLENGGFVRLHGTQIDRYMTDYMRLEGDVWLFSNELYEKQEDN